MAARFDAATDRVSHTATNPPLPSAGVSVAFWGYLSVDLGDFSTMIRLHANSGATTVVNLATGSSGETPCIFTVGGTVVGAQAMVAGQWSRIGVSVSGTTGTIYVAGASGAVSSASGTVGGVDVQPTGLTIGGRHAGDPSEWFNGRKQYERLWSSVLSQAQFEAEWASTVPVITSGLWANYPLSGAGDLNDASGNGRHLSAGSTAVTTEDGPPIAQPRGQFLAFL